MADNNEEFVISESDEEIVMENTEITNPEPKAVEPITRPKKPRTEKQKAALEKARQKRAEKIAQKKKEKEAEVSFVEQHKDKIKEIYDKMEGASASPNVEAVIEDEEPEPILKKPTKKAPKKKKVKKVVVNNYYEPSDSSDEELIEEQNNFYAKSKKKGKKTPAPNPNTQQYLEDPNIQYEEEVVATNNYTYNPYGNITFC